MTQNIKMCYLYCIGAALNSVHVCPHVMEWLKLRLTIVGLKDSKANTQQQSNVGWSQPFKCKSSIYPLLSLVSSSNLLEKCLGFSHTVIFCLCDWNCFVMKFHHYVLVLEARITSSKDEK